MKTSCKKFLCFIYSLFFAGCLLFLNISCGLDEFYYVDAPSVYNKQPIVDRYSDTDYTERYFEFYTNESGMAEYLDPGSGFSFMGTDIYYKIYNSYDSMVSERNSLNEASIKSEYTSATKLIDSYKFLPLKFDGQTKAVLIPASGKNQKVYVRLSNYQNDIYRARLVIDGVEIGVPRRNSVVGGSFDFGRNAYGSSSIHKIPVSSDSDVKYSSSSSNGKWYIPMYAVAMGRDSSYTITYSNIFYLGTVCIDQNSEDN